MWDKQDCFALSWASILNTKTSIVASPRGTCSIGHHSMKIGRDNALPLPGFEPTYSWLADERQKKCSRQEKRSVDKLKSAAQFSPIKNGCRLLVCLFVCLFVDPPRKSFFVFLRLFSIWKHLDWQLLSSKSNWSILQRIDIVVGTPQHSGSSCALDQVVLGLNQTSSFSVNLPF